MAVLTAGLGGKALTTDEGALLADQRLEFATVSCVKSIIATFIAALELPLALTVGL